MPTMRLCRVLAVLGLAAALSLPTAAAAAAQGKQHVGLHDMTCTSIMAEGEGLAKNASFDLTLVDQDNGSTLAARSVRSSEMGHFMVRLPARLNQVLSLRLVVARPDGTKVAFADHVMAKGAAMCNLPFTGPSRSATLLLVGTGSVGLGLLLVAGTARPLVRPRRR
jgi:RecA/RadA recombinase